MLPHQIWRLCVCMWFVQTALTARQGQGHYKNLRHTQHPQEPALRSEAGQDKNTERQTKADDMLKHMNLDADPCKDFYDYACGNWLQNQDVSQAKEGELLSHQSQMDQLVNRQVQSILEEPTTSDDRAWQRLVKDFYRSCRTCMKHSPVQRQYIQSFVLQNGGLPYISKTQWHPNYNWIQVIASLKNRYNFDILINLRIDRDVEKKNGRANSVYLEEPQTTILPAEYCSSIASQQLEETDKTFENIQKEVKLNLLNWFDMNGSEANRLAGDIITFEFELCKYMRKEHTYKKPEEYEDERRPRQRLGQERIHGGQRPQNNNPSLQYLQTLVNNYNIDFKQYVDISLGNNNVRQVFFKSEEYFQHLSNITQRGSKASLASYTLYRALTEFNFPIHEKGNERQSYCANKVMKYFPEVIGSMYNEKRIRQDIRTDLNDIFKDITESFSTILEMEQSRWLRDKIRTIKSKLNILKVTFPIYGPVMENIVGFSFRQQQSYWEKLESIMIYNANQTAQQLSRQVSDKQLEATGTTMTLIPWINELQTAWGMLQPPLYSINYPKAIKFSTVGAIMASELSKTFDEQGFLTHPMSVVQYNEDTLETFRNKSECFRAHMSNYLYNNPETYQNASKLRDFIASTNALDIAFSAYLKWLAKQSPDSSENLLEETLSDVNFTNTQLFFISYAQSRCSARHMQSIPPDYLPMDRHTMERLNVNGPLSNYLEFARDFGCSLGSDMNMDDKCFVY